MLFLYILFKISLILADDLFVLPQNRQANAGSTVLLECKSSNDLLLSNIQWIKDSITLVDQKTPILILKNTTSNDNGHYLCVVDSVHRSKPALLSIFEKPIITRGLKASKYRLNSRVELTCDVRGYPEVTIEWKKNDKTIRLGPKLIIDSIGHENEGEYLCLASNNLGKSESKGFITVYEKPNFNKILSNVTIGIETKSLTIECNANGRPKPVIYWAKSNNQEMSNDDFIILENGNLYIERLTKKYEGYYLCQASNEYGNIEMKTYVLIKSLQTLKPAPLIIYGPQNQTIPLNTQAILECKSLLGTQNQIDWFKGNSRITQFNTRKYNLEESGSLVINSVQKSDSDLYRCQVSNSNGQTNSTWAKLLIENPNNIHIRFQRNYDHSALPSAPSQPTSLTTTSTSVQLTWQPSSHTGHSKLVGFSIEYYSPEWSLNNGWSMLTDNIPPLANFYTISDLIPDTYYMFIVRAKNEQGWGPPSQVSDLVRTLTESRPLQTSQTYNNEDIIYLNDKADILSSSSVNITWKVLKLNFPIDGLRLKYRPIGSKDYKYEIIKDYRLKWTVLTSLFKFTAYELVAEPIISTKTSTESNLIQFKTLEDIPSASPINLQVKYETDTSVAIKWEPPEINQMNGIIIGYVINCYSDNSNLNINLNTNATTRAIILGSLISGMKYCIKVAAQTSVGIGPFSDKPKCIEMNDPNKINNLPISLQNIIFEPWFISLVVIITILTVVLFLYCIWNTFKFIIKKQKKKLKELEKTDANGNRYNLVGTNDGLWLDTTLPSTNATTESYLVCEPTKQDEAPTYAEIYSPNHYASTGLFVNSPQQNMNFTRTVSRNKGTLAKSQPNTPRINRVDSNGYDHLPPRPPPRFIEQTYNQPWNQPNIHSPIVHSTTLSRLLSNSTANSPMITNQYLITDENNRIYKIIPLQASDIPIQIVQPLQAETKKAIMTTNNQWLTGNVDESTTHSSCNDVNI